MVKLQGYLIEENYYNRQGKWSVVCWSVLQWSKFWKWQLHLWNPYIFVLCVMKWIVITIALVCSGC